MKKKIFIKYIKLVIILLFFIIFIKLIFNKNIEKFIDINETENNCKYVSSRGIMKSCDIYSNSNPVSSVKTLIDYDFTKGFDNCLIYVCSSAIPEFASKLYDINSDINYRFIIISGDADESIPNDIFTDTEFIKFIENDKLLYWYSQNCVGIHPKLKQIPIGLDYHTLSNNTNHSWGENIKPLEQEKLINFINKNSKPFWERENKCYSNFHFSINGAKFGYDRTDAMNSINKELVYYEPEQIKRKETWEKMSKICFIISPHGNGLDCHRTWESLCLGCIPIVKKSILDKLYEDLPVLIVNKWSDVNTELMNNTIENYKNKHLSNKFNYSKLSLQYWIDKIKI